MNVRDTVERDRLLVPVRLRLRPLLLRLFSLTRRSCTSNSASLFERLDELLLLLLELLRVPVVVDIVRAERDTVSLVLVSL